MCDIDDKETSIEKHCKKLIDMAKSIFSLLPDWQQFASIFFIHKSWSLISIFFFNSSHATLSSVNPELILNLVKENSCDLSSVSCINYIQSGQKQHLQKKAVFEREVNPKGELRLICHEIQKRKMYIKQQKLLLDLKFIRPIPLVTVGYSFLINLMCIQNI